MQPENLRHAPVLIAHPTGNANARQAVRALGDAGALASFHTTISWNADAAFKHLLPDPLRAELLRRSYPGIPRNLIHTHPWNEAMRLAARKLWPSLIRHEDGPFCIDAVYARFDSAVARAVARAASRGQAPRAVFAYDASALLSFKAAKEHGIGCVFELPTTHYRTSQRFLQEELELQPEWASSLSGIKDSPKKLARKDQEIGLADLILVPSAFVSKTLQSYPEPIAAPIVEVPYGAPQVGPPRLLTRRKEALRVLFVGNIGQAKGISYLVDAMRKVTAPCTLTLLGRPTAMPPILQEAFCLHRWIDTVPHGQVIEIMRSHDVLVLPTLFEGRALVALEALSQGLPVITTPNSGNEDVVQDGISGFIVPIRSSDAIAARLTQLSEDRDLLATMSEQARRIASECSWKRYRARLLSILNDFLATR